LRDVSTAVYGGPRWRLATLDCKPRQARKGATVVVDAGAEGTLAGDATLSYRALASVMRRLCRMRAKRLWRRARCGPQRSGFAFRVTQCVRVRCKSRRVDKAARGRQKCLCRHLPQTVALEWL